MGMDESLLTGESVLTAAQSPGGNGGTGVASVGAGVGISVSGTPTNPVVNNTGATSVNGSDNRVKTSPTTGAVVISQSAVADWSLTATRFFAVDAVNGDDTHAGFSDVSSAAAGAVAKKTIAAIADLIPPAGAGRVGQLIIANGGVNTSQTYADPLAFLAEISGYTHFSVLATGTNTNAGAVAFDGTANTQTYAGGITVPGLNAGGYNPTGTPTTTVVQMVKNGGGAPTLPAEPAAPLGYRIRFDINTSTAALRGICKTIVKVSGGDTVTINTALSTAPSAADVFYIEQPGVVLSSFAGVGVGGSESFTFAGLNFTNSIFLYQGSPSFMFCGCNQLVGARKNALSVINRVAALAQAGGTTSNRACGGGLRNSTTYSAGFAGAALNWTLGTFLGTAEILSSGGGNSIGDGTIFAAGLAVQGNFGDTNWNDHATAIGGITFPVRFLAAGTNVGFTCGLQIRGSRLQLVNNDFQNMGAHPAIQLVGTCDVVIAGAQSGSTGNTDVGLDLTQSRASRIQIGSTPTVTGTVGDVRLADGTIVSWAALAATGIVDTNGNQIIPTGQPPVGPVKSFSGMVVDPESGAFFSYLADTGFEVVGTPNNQVDPILYPSSARMITRLRGVAPLGTGTVPPKFTLYVNGVATAMTVTLPASIPGRVQAADTAHVVHLNDGDSFDVRVDFTGPTGGNQAVSATLEGPC